MKKVNNESVILSEVYRKLVVEFDIESMSIDDILSAIIVITKDYDPTPRPKGVLNALCDYKEFPVTRNGDKIEFIVEIDDEIKEEGGEIVEKPNNFKTRFTSGEEKVAKSVLDHFKEGFKVRNPSRMTFESCLEAAFPKIENGKAATTNLINKGWLKEVDGKIFIGPEGEKYLSP